MKYLWPRSGGRRHRRRHGTLVARMMAWLHECVKASAVNIHRAATPAATAIHPTGDRAGGAIPFHRHVFQNHESSRSHQHQRSPHAETTEAFGYRFTNGQNREQQALKEQQTCYPKLSGLRIAHTTDKRCRAAARPLRDTKGYSRALHPHTTGLLVAVGCCSDCSGETVMACFPFSCIPRATFFAFTAATPSSGPPAPVAGSGSNTTLVDSRMSAYPPMFARNAPHSRPRRPAYFRCLLSPRLGAFHWRRSLAVRGRALSATNSASNFATSWPSPHRSRP